MDRPFARRLVVCIVTLLALTATGTVVAGELDGVGDERFAAGATDGDVLTVASDGSAEYASVQAAVDAASDGDTIRVRSSTYRESVTLEKNVTVVAPRGATLDGSGLEGDADGIVIDDAAPVVDGFAIEGYHVGVDARVSSGDWTLSNATVRNAEFLPISASGTSGDWHLGNVTVRDVDRSEAISTSGTAGDWRLTDVAVRNVTLGSGIDAGESTGDWSATNLSVTDVDFVALDVAYASGDWRLVNSTVRDTTLGIGAIEASGDWTVRRSTVANVSVSERIDFRRPAFEEGTAIHAARTNGTWTVRGNRFVDVEAGGVVAPDADPAGDARQNWWDGAAGTDGERCAGNLDCSDSLQAWPPESSLAPSATATETTASVTDVPSTDSNAVTATGNDDEATRTRATSTTADGPLSPILGVLGLVLGALLAARHARSRR